jgi:hypothetical protein
MGQAGLGATVIGGPGGAGRSEAEERERSTWLCEDPDIWGDDVEETAPSVIGELSPTRYVGERPSHTDHIGQLAEAVPTKPSTSEIDEENDVDLLLDELEAELDREIAELGMEDRGAR